MKNHTRRPRAYYETLYQRRLDERLTFADLSTESGVPVATLQYWFRRFKAEQGAEHPAPSDDTGAFVRIAVDGPSDSAAVEVVLRDNIRLSVRAGFDEHTVLRLVQLLGC
jgi:hypothetical protein